MSNNTNTIGAFLGAAYDEEDAKKVKHELETVTSELDAANKNAKFEEASDYVNKNLKEIIDSSMESLPGLFRVMADSEDSKMYQVGASFIKTLSEINKTYYEVNKPFGGVQGGKGSNSGEQTGGITQNVQINNSEVRLMKPSDLLDD